MAKQISQRRHGALKQTLLSAGIALFLGLGPSTSSRAAFMADAASEHTQVVNAVQLLLSYYEQLQMVANTYDTYKKTFETVVNLEKQFENLDESVLAGMSGPVINKIAQLGSLSRQMTRTMHSGRSAIDVLERTITGANAANMSIEDYTEARAVLAQKDSDMYAASYEQDVARMRDFQEQAGQLRHMASAASGITSHIQGFQEIVSATVRVEAQMASLNGAISRLNSMTAREGRIEQVEAKFGKARMDKMLAYAREQEAAGVDVPSPFAYGVDPSTTGGGDGGTRPDRPPRPPRP